MTVDDGWTVEEAMRVMAVSRGRADPRTRYEISMGDRLATELAAAHPLEEREAAGRAILKAAACLGALFDPRQQPDVDHHDLTSAVIAVNILGFAGERLGAFPARYAGPCSGCGEWFKEGDPIVRSVLAGQWRCLLCCEAAS